MAAPRGTKYLVINGNLKALKATVEESRVAEIIAELQAKGRQVDRVQKPPTLATLERWVDNGVAKATDGCRVEPDGECPHGKPSWLRILGYI